jgi:hypothetical protein
MLSGISISTESRACLIMSRELALIRVFWTCLCIPWGRRVREAQHVVLFDIYLFVLEKQSGCSSMVVIQVFVYIYIYVYVLTHMIWSDRIVFFG